MADPSLLAEKPELTLYSTMLERNGCYVVSNGRQTASVLRVGCQRRGLSDSLHHWKYEDDRHATPRLAALCRLDGPSYMEIGSRCKSQVCDGVEPLSFVSDDIEFGHVWCLWTYQSNGDPLPSYRGGPYLLPVGPDPETTALVWWNHLNRATRVAIAVKYIDCSSGVSEVAVINERKQLKAAAA